MPQNYAPAVAPGYSQGVDATAADTQSSYRFFLPSAKVHFVKPVYDKDKKPVTVFRPFPCRSFSDGNNSFEPYRVDPGGRNHFGWWLQRVWVAWNVGKPATSFIVHDPAWGVFDIRLTPLNLLARAIGYAVKKGQGKATEWAQMLKRPWEPTDRMLLEWSGLKDGARGEGAALTNPKELYLMQGIVPMLGGKVTFSRTQTMPGWGKNDTCVFGLTAGAGKRMLELLSAEKDGFRGHPADFENRYVEGDPVSVEGGRYLYVYPKGGDPRQARMQSSPVDMLAQMSAAGRGGKGGAEEKDEVGFDCHFEPTFQGNPAALSGKVHREMVRDKWQHWNPVYDHTGKVIDPGILWYPTYVEQAQILGRIFPAAALEYAFYGEHNDWLTPEIRAAAVQARSASVPAAPPAFTPPQTTQTTQQPFNPFDGVVPAGWSDALDQPHLPEASVTPASVTPVDSALPTPMDYLGDDPMAALAAQSNALLDVPALPVSNLPTQDALSAGFEAPPTETPASTNQPAQSPAARLAAAKQALRNSSTGS